MNEFLQPIPSLNLPCICHACSDKSNYVMHMHKETEIIYVEKGNLDIVIDFVKYTVKPNHIVFINALTPHMLLHNTEDEVLLSCIQFLPETTYRCSKDYISRTLFEWFTNKKENPFSFFEVTEETETCHIIKTMFLLFGSKSVGVEAQIQAQLLMLCDSLCKSNPLPISDTTDYTDSDYTEVANLIDHITKNYTLTFTQENTKKFLSSDRASELFEKITGFDTMQYCENYRYSLTATGLCAMTYPAEKICRMAGFDINDEFCRNFAKRYESTPNDFGDRILSYICTSPSSPIPKVHECVNDFKEMSPKENYKLPVPQRMISARTEDKITHSLAIHSFFKIIFVNSGEGILETRDNTIVLKSGSMIVLRPYEKYRFTKFTQKTDVFFIQFYLPALYCGKTEILQTDTLKKMSFNARTTLCIYDESSLALKKCHDALTKKREQLLCESEAFLRSICFEILAHLVKHSDSSKTPQDDKVSKIVAYIDYHYTEKLMLEELGERFGVSYSHLSRRFKKLTGMSFNKYINEKRMSHADTMLTQTDYSIRKIAALLGYCRRSHFTEQFVKHYKTTPSEYRNQYNKK